MIQYINPRGMIIIEIGSWIGSSACLFAKHFKQVICVDPFLPVEDTITEKYNMAEVERVFVKNISRFKNITHLKHPSCDLINLKLNADVVYIDGDHHPEAVLKDIDIAKKIATKYIAGHDYWPKKFDGVIKAVRMKLGKPDKVFPDTSWIKAVV